jgi:ribonuclease P protein component
VLAADHRLRRRVDFAATIRGGRRAARGALVVHLDLSAASKRTPAKAKPAPQRAGFVVSRSVGGAVVRNLVKRRLRHLVRDRIGTLPEGAILVVRALPAAANRTYPELGADLDGAIARASAGRRR